MRSRRAVRVTLYTKQDCPLCDEAKRVLHELRRGFALSVEEVDIASRESLAERYGELVPVLKIAGGPSLFGKIDPDRLREAVSSAARAGGGD